MDQDQMVLHLSRMTQDEVLDLLLQEVRNAKALKKSTEKAGSAERNYSARKESKSWALSEQYEKSKARIKIIAKFLI